MGHCQQQTRIPSEAYNFSGKTGRKKQPASLFGEQVVTDMTKDCTRLFHHAYFDNLFTSTRLMRLLLEIKSRACGTDHAGRKD
jgi:hypothetical protein